MAKDTTAQAAQQDKTAAAPNAEAPESTIMHVKVYAPYKTYFEGDAQSVSAENTTGPFDILPKHHNFFTLLIPCDIVIRTDRGEERVSIQRGIMHVKANTVIVFLDV